jgi:hypothetical protein
MGYVIRPFGPTIAIQNSGAFGLFANGTGTASFDHVRITQYPDPALSLAPVLPRLGSSLVSFNDAIIPAGTAATVYIGTDGINFPSAVTSGSTIPGLTTQPSPTIDTFNTNTSANYTNTSKSGGSAATVAYDLTKSRITLTGGSGGLYLNSAISSADIVMCVMDKSDTGGPAWCFVDQSNFYYLVIADDHASVGTPNQMTLYRAGYSALIESDAPLAYYRVGEASGTSAADSSGHGNTGTYAGSGVTYAQAGAISGDTNTAVLFNGSTGKMTLPTSVNPETGSFTFECWIKVSAYPGGGTSILANYNTPSSNIGAGFGMNTSGQVNWTVVNGSGSFVSITSSAITTGVYHHLVGTYDGTTSKFYFDGSLVGSTTTTFSANTTDAIQVGSSPYNDYHPGYVDEVAIYSTALSASRVTAHYNAATTPPSTQLAAAAISWPRSTAGTSPYKCIRVTILSGVITAYFDGTQILQYTDGAPLGAGKAGLFNNGGTSRYYQLRVQPQGSYVSGTPAGDVVTGGFIYTKQALSTTDPSVSPQLPSLTTSARSPQIATGALIPQLHDPSKPFAALYSTEVTSLASTSGDFFTRVADDGSVTFTERFATPAPFCLYSTDLLYKPMLGGATNGVQATNSADLYRNQVIVTNTTSLVVITNEEKIADGTATSWNLAYPLYTAPKIIVAGVTKTVGVKGVDTGKDLYWQFGNNTITQDSGASKISSGYILSFSYTGQYADQVIVNNYAEQAARAAVEKNTGIVVAIVDGQGMLSSNAINYAQGLLSQNGSNNTVEVIATTSRLGAELLDVGQVVPVFFPELNLNNVQLLIMKLTRTGYQLSDGSVRYEYTIDASDGPNLNRWASAIGL